ncbi:MerR family transcriptional regulator [Desulfitobacterium sp. PCE1]|uniref:MerR family transcriptional regulator n=1 Tax=Desulfitobacterium sp. PCE1 TaxID=146907 RepID=UPI00037E5DC3|nr:MerR family transcriptional regulator [Desulfitobacterium sp. PCE1]
MMTIHELANYSGISVRTLHYYDKIDLLKPCCIEQNGYRKYNDDSLRRLQQIMFYKEMDLPLKKIKDIMNQSSFDQKTAIKDQKDFLVAKRNRLNKLIEQMEQILEGDNTMDFKVFEHNELEEVFRSRIMQLDEYYQQSLISQYGSIEACIESMMKNEAKIKESAVKHYGSIDKYIESLKKEPLPEKGMGKLQLKLDGIVKQITAHKGRDVSNPEIQKLVDEWKETFKEISEKDDISEAFRRIYHAYMNSREVIEMMDEIYGNGSIVFVGKAMEYNDKASNRL